MTISDVSTATTSEVDQKKLGRILGLLKPPQQDYKALADEALGLWSSLPSQPSVERAVAIYFGRFAQGYVIWQDSYNYPKVHEYFYAAYLQALEEGNTTLSPELREMFAQLSEAVIADTHCENALISNDPQGLLDAAKQAARCYGAALDKLHQSSLSSLLREPIEPYLRMNIHHARGLELCAEMYLAPEKTEAEKQKEIAQILESLGPMSRELASELRAHFSSAQRLTQVYAQKITDLHVKEGSLWLRATGYLGEDRTHQIFDDLKETGEDKVQAIREKTGLHIKDIWHDNLQDIFETVLGTHYLDEVIFYLSTDDYPLTFSIRDGKKEIPYSVETFQVSLSRFGTVSVEFEIPIKDASISHVRVLESLISPHAGQFEFVWHSPARDVLSDVEKESTDYVDCFLSAREWIKSIRQAKPGVGSSILTEMEQALVDWESMLGKLARELPYEFTEDDQEDDQSPRQDCFQRMHDLAQQWFQEALASNFPQEFVEEGKHIFPEGFRFSRFMDIAEEVLENHIKRYLVREGLSPEESKDIGQLFSFDPNTGWQTILLCDILTLVEHSGRRDEPASEWDYHRFTEHLEFKGLIIQNREARSAIDDWLFVKMPDYKNLATIRSHEHDSMYIGENRAFFYLPDDPQFLTEQYVDTAKFIDSIRNLLLSFNTNAKGKIEDLEEYFDEYAKNERAKSEKTVKKRLGKSLKLPWFRHNRKEQIKDLEDSLKEIRSQHDRIEIFRTRADKILDLLRACTVSKYQDHSDLLNAMISASRLDATRDSLEHNIESLEHFHIYMSGLMERQMDERNQKKQDKLNNRILLLTVISAVSAIIAILQAILQILPKL